jgi:hypothetical protein
VETGTGGAVLMGSLCSPDRALHGWENPTPDQKNENRGHSRAGLATENCDRDWAAPFAARGEIGRGNRAGELKRDWSRWRQKKQNQNGTTMACAPDTQETKTSTKLRASANRASSKQGNFSQPANQKGKTNSAYEIQKSIFLLRMNKITTDPQMSPSSFTHLIEN